MTTSQDMALDYLLALNSGEQQVLVKLQRTITKVIAAKPEPLMSSKPGKGIKAKAVRENTPNNSTPSLGLILPEKGTYDARAFIVAMRKTSDRNEQIKLLAGYVGYDVSLSFGAQEANARSRALRELNVRKVMNGSRADDRNAARNLQGVNAVGGCPDAKAKRLANLAAQEVDIVEAMIRHENTACNESLPLADRLLARGMVEIERDRLASVRQIIAATEG